MAETPLTDQDLKDYEDSVDVAVENQPIENAKLPALNQQTEASFSFVWLIVVILIAAGFYFYYYKKKQEGTQGEEVDEEAGEPAEEEKN